MRDVDAGAARSREAAGASIPERPERCGVSADRAADSAGEAWRPQARGRPARGAERDPLRAVHRLPMGGVAEGPGAEEHGTLVLQAVGVGRHPGAATSRTLRGGARARGPRGQPGGGGD